MNQELDYAEMLEIPVETVTVKRKEKKRRARENDSELSEIGRAHVLTPVTT